MIKAVEARQKCPYPSECPMGPKREGYRCGMSFALQRKEPEEAEPTTELVCTFCWGNIMSFQSFLAARREQERQATGGIIIAQQGPPPAALPGAGFRG